MKIRWGMIAVLATFVLSLVVLIERKPVTAAAQSPAPAKTAVLSSATGQSLQFPKPPWRSTPRLPSRNAWSPTRSMRTTTP